MDLESPSNFQVKEKKLFKSVHKQEIGHLLSSESFELKYNIGIGILIEFPSQEKKIVKSVYKKEIGLLWSSESFEVKYSIGFGIPVEFPSQKIIEIGLKKKKIRL